MDSDTSGNHSENDEINKIKMIKHVALEDNEVSELNQAEMSAIDIDTREDKLAFHKFYSRGIEELKTIPMVVMDNIAPLSSIPSHSLESEGN